MTGLQACLQAVESKAQGPHAPQVPQIPPQEGREIPLTSQEAARGSPRSCAKAHSIPCSQERPHTAPSQGAGCSGSAHG